MSDAPYVTTAGVKEQQTLVRASGGPSGVSARAALGSTTSYGTPPPIQAQFGDISLRQWRFILQGSARELLLNWWAANPESRRSARYAERTVYCLRLVLPDEVGVGVLYFPESASAGFSGVMTCGSVWGCPVCSSKITERRRLEIQEVIDASDLLPVLVTLTLQHNRAERLDDVLDGLLSARAAFFRGAPFKRARAKWGIVDRARSLEPTHGQNGWHPHTHELFMVDAERFDLEAFERWATARWSVMAARSGRYASAVYGLDVVVGDAAVAGYVVKVGGAWAVSEPTERPARGEPRSRRNGQRVGPVS